DAAPDEQVQTPASPDALPSVDTSEDTQNTAPPEAATETVTEAEAGSGAVETSLRPPSRPSRPATATAEPAPETPSQTNAASSDDVANALAQSLANGGATSETETTGADAIGPPLTATEREGFRVAVQGCWVVDTGSEAARVTITVAFELNLEGRVVANDVRMLSGTGGGEAAIRSAFGAARRAVLRCQTETGYDLPADKYEHWRVVELTFNPEEMRLR
ncbi:MAG: cell envelope biogenesis protein TolA, partial [Rhodobacteraceae bacterium]|nr:cell envelope biogenesis protein TolA [Paracoccaceae bacterium]